MAREETRWVRISPHHFGCAELIIYSSNPTLEFVAAPALAPPEVQVDAALMERYNKELEAVRPHPVYVSLNVLT